MENLDPKKEESLLHELGNTSNTSMVSSKFIIVVVVVAVLGIVSGFLLTQTKSGSSVSLTGEVSKDSITKGTVEGSDDMKTFSDSTSGILEEGGIEDEGQYHLVRPGGESQNVYLTSSLVDLSKYLKRKIKVWGQTQKAMKAGWLMDVGKVEVLE